MKSKLVQIFFFSGPEVQTTEVLHSDLPALSGARTYWRESMPDHERGKKLKQKIAANLGWPTGSSQDEAPPVEDNLPPAPIH